MGNREDVIGFGLLGTAIGAFIGIIFELMTPSCSPATNITNDPSTLFSAIASNVVCLIIVTICGVVGTAIGGLYGGLKP